MYISKIDIENYRSIREQQSLPITKIGGKECLLLLGINESGKSNILKAVSLLDKSAAVRYEADCHADAEQVNESILVWFKLETSNPDFFRKQLISSGLDAELAAVAEFDEIYRGVEIDRTGRHDIHHVEMPKSKTYEKYVLVDGRIEKRTSANEVLDEGSSVTNLLTQDKFSNFVFEQLRAAFDSNTPKVVFWRSSPEYRITGRINLESFKENTAELLLYCRLRYERKD